MTTLFQRRARLVLASPVAADFKSVSAQVTQIECGGPTGMRLQFKVTKTLAKPPNTAEITVTNLSKQSRSALDPRGVKVLLSAGYAGDAGEQSTVEQIFIGDASYVDHHHEGPEWETKIECGDGDRAFHFSRAAASFAPGAKVQTVLNFLSKKLGLGLGNVQAVAATLDQEYTQGYAVSGDASRELDKAIRAIGLEWSIQDGQVQILPPGGSLQTVVVWSPATGLIGSPSHGSSNKKGTPPTLKAKSLLSPSVSPGKRILLESTAHAGLYVVQKVEHSGDTDGGEWYTDVEATAA